MKKVVFVVLSHVLTPEQIADLGEAQVILLSDVNAELAAQCRAVKATASLEEVQELAARVVAEAVKAEATHFVCQGEPCLLLWANMFAAGQFNYDYSCIPCNIQNQNNMFWMKLQNGEKVRSVKLSCLQSTTERVSVETTNPETGEVTKTSTFKHVQWRNMF